MASSKEWLERVSLVKVKFLNMTSKNFQIKFQIQLSVIGRGRNTLLDLHNSSQDNQLHSLIVNYRNL